LLKKVSKQEAQSITDYFSGLPRYKDDLILCRMSKITGQDHEIFFKSQRSTCKLGVTDFVSIVAVLKLTTESE